MFVNVAPGAPKFSARYGDAAYNALTNAATPYYLTNYGVFALNVFTQRNNLAAAPGLLVEIHMWARNLRTAGWAAAVGGFAGLDNLPDLNIFDVCQIISYNWALGQVWSLAVDAGVPMVLVNDAKRNNVGCWLFHYHCHNHCRLAT